MKTKKNEREKMKIKHGQITMEFLLSFLIGIVLVFTITTAMLNFYSKAQEHEKRIEEIIATENLARTLDSFASSGRYKITDITNRSYRIQDDLLLIDFEGKIIVGNTIYNKGENNAEPI